MNFFALMFVAVILFVLVSCLLLFVRILRSGLLRINPIRCIALVMLIVLIMTLVSVIVFLCMNTAVTGDDSVFAKLRVRISGMLLRHFSSRLSPALPIKSLDDIYKGTDPVQEEYAADKPTSESEPAPAWQTQMQPGGAAYDEDLSVFLTFMNPFYNGTATPASSIRLLADYMLDMLNRHRENGLPFTLPPVFTVKYAQPSSEICRESSLSGYDEQIAFLMQNERRANDYHFIMIDAMNSFSYCSKEKDPYRQTLYYAELAFYGLANEYVFTDSIDPAFAADQFYRLAQIYDSVSMLIDDIDRRCKMVFTATAALELSFDSLEEADLVNEKPIYYENIPELYSVMVLRLEQYMDSHQAYRDLYPPEHELTFKGKAR